MQFFNSTICCARFNGTSIRADLPHKSSSPDEGTTGNTYGIGITYSF